MATVSLMSVRALFGVILTNVYCVCFFDGCSCVKVFASYVHYVCFVEYCLCIVWGECLRISTVFVSSMAVCVFFIFIFFFFYFFFFFFFLLLLLLLFLLFSLGFSLGHCVCV